MAELQESEETFELRRCEYEREMWEVERGLQVCMLPPSVKEPWGSQVPCTAAHKGIVVGCGLGNNSSLNTFFSKYCLRYKSSL